MHVTLGVTAQTTMYAAIAMRTYLCVLAQYRRARDGGA